MSSTSQTDSVAPVAAGRVKHSSGLHLSADQAKDVPAGLKNESVIIPSTSAPTWGGFFTLDLKEKPAIVRNLTLQFFPTTLTCTGTATSYPRYIPGFFWFTRIELVINSQVIDTIYGNEQFIINQLKFQDSERIYLNNQAGNYACGAQRNTIATSASPTFFVNLETFCDQCKYLLLTDQHNIQIRVYQDTLANVVDLSSNQSLPVSTLSTVNLIADITRLPSDIANTQMAAMAKTPFSYIYHDLRYGLFSVNTGVTQTNIVLTPVVGKVAAIFFTVRPTASLTNANAFSYTKIANFSLLNSSSTNIVGGQAITSQMALQYLNAMWFRSSYTTETDIGSNITGVVENNGANVYAWSFSSDIQTALRKGQCVGDYQFSGNEQLQITFVSALAAPVQVDVYALTESIIQQGVNTVQKISM